MSTDSVDQHRLLANQQLSRLMQHQSRSSVFGLDWHETHVRSHHRLADRRRIRRVDLATPNVCFHVGRRHDLHLMPHRNNFSSPKMGCAASFHSDEAWREPREELPHLRTTQFATNHDPAFKSPLHELETHSSPSLIRSW